MNILPNWRPDLWADHTLKMLDCTAELFERAEYWSGREWVRYEIKDPARNRIARGTAATTDEAKAIVWELVVLRWNAGVGR